MPIQVDIGTTFGTRCIKFGTSRGKFGTGKKKETGKI